MQIDNMKQEVFSNNDIVIAGTKTASNGLNGIPVVRFNPCGDTIWSILLSTDTNSLFLIDLKIDQQENIILAGNFIVRNIERNAFLISLASDGTLNYFKVFDTGTADILYAMDVNSMNEILILFKRNIGQAGPNSQNTLARFNSTGHLQWMKQYGYTYVWGQMCASKDGGALLADSKQIVKIDNLGNVSWNREFENNLYSRNHFEVPSGYVFFRYRNSGAHNSYVSMITKAGNLKWNSQQLSSFRAIGGILRKNGNLLFLGNFSFQSTINNPTFIEIDTSNGNILRTYIHEKSSPLSVPSDLSELNDSSIIYSSNENLDLARRLLISRVNDTLARVNCKDTSINLNYPRDSSIILHGNPWLAQSVSIPLQEPKLNVSPFIILFDQISCEFRYPLTLELGMDTTICKGNSFTLSASGRFDGYAWSTGNRSRSIQVEKPGTYWLKAWISCDTISDTISISHHQIPLLNLGKDTTICEGSALMLSTNNEEIAYWNTGDTSASITVNQAGIYSAIVPSACGSVFDTIQIKNYPKLWLNLDNDTTLCKGESLTLSVDTNASQIIWSTGVELSSPSIEAVSAGIYQVKIANECDTLYDKIKIDFHPETQFVLEQSKDTARVLDSVFFRLLKPHKFQFLQWDFGDGQFSREKISLHNYQETGLMQTGFSLIDSLGCEYDSSLLIYIQSLPFHLPNVFTPNGDGINDFFEVYGEGINSMEIKIFNRWGKLIYAAEKAAWNGRTLNGKAAEEGTYFYQIHFQQSGNSPQSVNGVINLMRNGRNDKKGYSP
ncbi:MAG: gliding motility-associated C-terminal domain-containing protein [Vicingaceae bacterium]